MLRFGRKAAKAFARRAIHLRGSHAGPWLRYGSRMRTLYLLRHGKAESVTSGGRDYDRALAPRGQRDSTRMGAHLAECPDPPRWFLCSPARRATQTLDCVRESLPLGDDGEFQQNLYLASAEQIFERVCEVDDMVDSLLVVGHNPGLEQLAASLIRPPKRDPHAWVLPNFPTAALAMLRFDVDRWFDLAPRCGEMVFTTPKRLAATR
jgi:phosphohistidine phosphatase